MRKTREWSGLRFAIAALGLFTWAGSDLQAAAITNATMTYDTAGSVSTTGVSGAGNVISYIPVTSGSFTSPSFLSLGVFQVAPLKDGQATTYDNTPFTITLLPASVNGETVSADVTPISLTGVLNGTITGSSQSSVVATFDPIADPSFSTGSYTHTVNLTDATLSLVPSGTGGQTSIQAGFQSSGGEAPVPEPTTIALFLTTLGGIGLRHRVLAGRQKAQA